MAPLAVMLIDVVVQVNVPLVGFTITVGAVVLEVIFEVAVAVQPFAVVVPVTV